MQTISLSAEHK